MSQNSQNRIGNAVRSPIAMSLHLERRSVQPAAREASQTQDRRPTRVSPMPISRSNATEEGGTRKGYQRDVIGWYRTKLCTCHINNVIALVTVTRNRRSNDATSSARPRTRAAAAPSTPTKPAPTASVEPSSSFRTRIVDKHLGRVAHEISRLSADLQ